MGEKKSTVKLPNGKVYALRVFLGDDADRSHSPGKAQDETRPRYVGSLKQKVIQAATELRNRGVKPSASAIYDELDE